MRTRQSLALSVATLVLAITGLLLLAGCKKEEAAPTKPATPAATIAAEQVVNASCPILGTKLDRANLPDGLTRMFQGKKVGFCCDGCPQAWDKLTEAQKTEKLAAAMK